MTFQDSFRRQQAEFRAGSSTISPAARACGDPVGRRHGHLLALKYEHENLYPAIRGDDGAMKFLCMRRVQWWKSKRCGDDFLSNTPTRNLASSQVSCVNFLLPLAAIPGALDVVVQHIDANAGLVVPIEYSRFQSLVEFEWVGLAGSLEGRAATRGANCTSADAMLIAQTSSGSRAYLIEWKCCEEYSSGRCLAEGPQGATRLARYHPLYSSSFRGNVPVQELFYEPFYQLMRLRLLADKIVRGGEFGVRSAKVVVVCPDDNAAYRETITSPGLKGTFPMASTVHDVMKEVLTDPEGLIVTSPARLLAAIRASRAAERAGSWLAYHRERYGW